jgi:hypothetical protein
VGPVICSILVDDFETGAETGLACGGLMAPTMAIVASTAAIPYPTTGFMVILSIGLVIATTLTHLCAAGKVACQQAY